MVLTGVVQNFGGLVAVRILLGVFEYVHSDPFIDHGEDAPQMLMWKIGQDSSQAQSTYARIGICLRT